MFVVVLYDGQSDEDEVRLERVAALASVHDALPDSGFVVTVFGPYMFQICHNSDAAGASDVLRGLGAPLVHSRCKKIHTFYAQTA